MAFHHSPALLSNNSPFNSVFIYTFTQTLYLACGAITESAVTCNLNFPVLVNLIKDMISIVLQHRCRILGSTHFPKHVPKERMASRFIEVARFASFSFT